MSKPNGILAMDPENYREIDGVVFDLDSYEKHCAPAEPALEPEPEVPAKPIPIPEGILAMNPAHYHAIDGVAMDEDSFARHKQPPATVEPKPEEVVVDEPTPTGVFAVDPYPDGWYPAEDGQPPIPIMGGALPPVEILENGVHVVTVTRTVFLHTGSGSGSGSYVTSYTTSYRTSYLSSGSGSYVFGSCTYLVGGYGLELV